MVSGPLRVHVCWKLIIYGSTEPRSCLIAHMISWSHTPFPMVQTWKWQHRASCSAKLIEWASHLIEFHCSYSSVSTSAQVALTAATRHCTGTVHILLCECMHLFCRCRCRPRSEYNTVSFSYLSCITDSKSVMQEMMSMMSWLCFCQKQVSCSALLVQTGAFCHWLDVRVTCAILQLLDSGPKR